MQKSILAFLLLFVAVFPFSINAQKSKTDAVSQKPNIIFILADDLGVGDIGVFYQNSRKQSKDRSLPFELTPNIDAMAARGAVLTQSYCNAPVCAPSRASLMLGVNQGHANVRDNQFDKALEDNYTLPSVLRTAGYATWAIGKWGLQGLGNDWPAKPVNRGFDYYFGYMRHSDGHEHYPKEGPYKGPKELWENTKEVSKDFDKCYTADLWTAMAKKLIFEHSQKSSQPFFMYLAYDTPHAILQLPTQPYPQGSGLKGGIQWTGKPGAMINTASGKIDSWTQPEYASATYDNDKNPATPEVPWPATYKRYATAVSRIDAAVGDVLQLLKDLHIADNTIVVFTSDNGPSIESYLPETFVPYHPTFFASYGPFDGIKRDCWEGGIRMPTIAAWPGHIGAGKTVSLPHSSSDWMATLLDVAALPPPVRTDGVSLLPALTGKGKQLTPLVYIEYANDAKTPAFKEFEPRRRNAIRNQMQAIRMGDYMGVRYDIKNADDSFEIYNVVTDPKEITNLATKASMTALQQQMKEKVLQVRRPDTGAMRPYDNAFVPSVRVKKTMPGVLWKAYDGAYEWIPKTNALTPVKTGSATTISANDYHFKKSGTVCFEGYIDVPTDGEYTFYLTAYSGAFLRIHEAAVIDADYKYKGGEERSGSIRLKAGLHPFTLSYRALQGATNLSLQWKGPGRTKQTIPAQAFVHN